MIDMKYFLSTLILIIFDAGAIIISIMLGGYTRSILDDSPFFQIAFTHPISHYLASPVLIIVLALFFYEGIYIKRFDFWHESKQIIKALIIGLVLTFAFLAMTKSITEYSRAAIFFIFTWMMILVPLEKYFIKHLLYRLGIWKKKVAVYNDDPFIKEKILNNPYLGYIHTNQLHANTIFVNSQNTDLNTLQTIIEEEIRHNHEVMFIPLINEYDLTQSTLYQLFNTRTNLIVYTNRLKSIYRKWIHVMFNYTLAILFLPLLLPIIFIIAIFIKKESPGPIFFSHTRIGKHGKRINMLKFRSMYHDAQERLEKLLNENEEIRNEWEKNFKLKNDPRITKVGAFLRKTSLDELPQIFNVLKGEMNFVGPRPVVKEELVMYYKENAKYYLMVKPGITGLWQVSGRSDTGYDFRVKADKWYVTNWSLWLDIVILLKTIKAVLTKEGAY